MFESFFPRADDVGGWNLGALSVNSNLKLTRIYVYKIYIHKTFMSYVHTFLTIIYGADKDYGVIILRMYFREKSRP